MSEERMRILDMVREGKITADEAVRLLEAMKSAGGAGSSAEAAGGTASSESAPHSRHDDDPVSQAVGSVVDAVRNAFGGGAWRGPAGRPGGPWAGPWGGWGGSWAGGWGGNWEHGAGWHGHGGHLQGEERRRQRESEGWTIGSFSEGDRGTFDVPEGAKVRVESEAGAVEVKASDGPSRLDLEGDDFYNFATYVARKGDEVIVASYRKEHHAKMPRLVVSLPTHVNRLNVHTAGGSVQARGFSCETSLKTAGGSVTVAAHGEGALEIRTAGGSVDVEGQPVTLNARTAGGSIRFKGRTTALDAKTAGGSINAEGVTLSSGVHRAQTAGGSVNVRLTPESSVAIEASAGAGRINVDLPGVQGQMSGSRVAPRYSGQFNGSGATLELRTVGGSINVGLAATPAETVAA